MTELAKRYTVFLLDADNTVLDFHKSSEISLQNAFSEFSIAWKENYLDTFTELNDKLWKDLEEKKLTRQELFETRFGLYLRLLGFSEISDTRFNEIYLTSLETTPVYIDGAEDFLKKLKRAGKIYIVTNGTAKIQKSRFSVSGLNDYIERAFVSEIIGYDKPSLKYSEYVAKHIPNFSKESAVWIGDSLSADISAANLFGVDSIWYNRFSVERKGDAVPTYTAKGYDDICRILYIN